MSWHSRLDKDYTQYFSFLRGEKNIVIAHAIKYITVAEVKCTKMPKNARVQIVLAPRALIIVGSHVRA